MKKLIIKLVIMGTLAIGLNATALATNKPDLDHLTPQRITPVKDFTDELQAVADLPSSSLEEVITTIIKTILEVSMLITLIALIVAAVYFLISQGKDEDLTKAKNIILYLIIGMGIIAGSLGIIAGITQFKFLE